MKPPASSRTSPGLAAASKASGNGQSPLSRLRDDAWRASTVAIVAPVVSSSSASIRSIAPSYAETPVFPQHPGDAEELAGGVVSEVVAGLLDGVAVEVLDNAGQRVDVGVLAVADVPDVRADVAHDPAREPPSVFAFRKSLASNRSRPSRWNAHSTCSRVNAKSSTSTSSNSSSVPPWASAAFELPTASGSPRSCRRRPPQEPPPRREP